MNSFTDTLDRHLDAIQARDFETFVSTLTSGEILTLLLPNGAYSERRADFVQAMQAWFADPDWQMEFELLHTVESAAMGFALLSVCYDDKDQQGQPYQLRYYLTLIFAKEGERWALIHDQNTLQREA